MKVQAVSSHLLFLLLLLLGPSPSYGFLDDFFCWLFGWNCDDDGFTAPIATTACGVELPIDVIFGSGVIDGGFTTASATIPTTNNQVMVGLRGKLRHDSNNGENAANTFYSLGDGTYGPFLGRQVPVSDPTTGEWSVEFSIDTDVGCTSACVTLDQYDYYFEMDQDPSYAVNYKPVYGVGDIINGGNPNQANAVFWDHSLGTTATGNGLGTEAADATDYANLLSAFTVAQQSWKATWMAIPALSFAPYAPGMYDFKLAVRDKATGEDWVSVTIRVLVENTIIAPDFPPSTTADCINLLMLGGVFLTQEECEASFDFDICPA